MPALAPDEMPGVCVLVATAAAGLGVEALEETGFGEIEDDDEDEIELDDIVEEGIEVEEAKSVD